MRCSPSLCAIPTAWGCSPPFLVVCVVQPGLALCSAHPLCGFRCSLFQVIGKEGNLVDLADSPLAGNVRIFTDYDPEWEVDVASLQMLEQIGGWRWQWAWVWVQPVGACCSAQAHDGGADLPCMPVVHGEEGRGQAWEGGVPPSTYCCMPAAFS